MVGNDVICVGSVAKARYMLGKNISRHREGHRGDWLVTWWRVEASDERHARQVGATQLEGTTSEPTPRENSEYLLAPDISCTKREMRISAVTRCGDTNNGEDVCGRVLLIVNMIC